MGSLEEIHRFFNGLPVGSRVRVILKPGFEVVDSEEDGGLVVKMGVCDISSGERTVIEGVYVDYLCFGNDGMAAIDAHYMEGIADSSRTIPVWTSYIEYYGVVKRAD